MTGITLNTTFSGVGLPTAKSLAAQVAALPGFRAWAQMDPEYVTLSAAKIAEITCRAGSGVRFTQADANRRATLTTGALGPYAAATFAGADTVADGQLDYYDPVGLGTTAGAPFTVAAVVRPTVITAMDTIVTRYTSASDRVLLQMTPAGILDFKIGAAGQRNLPDVRVGDWNIVIAGWDGTTMRLHLNGIDSAGAGAGNTGAAEWRVGAMAASPAGGLGFDGQIADVVFFASDVLGVAAHKATLMEYFDRVYGL